MLCVSRVYTALLLLLLDVLTVDRAVENIGFGWFQIKLSLFTGLVWVCICICLYNLMAAVAVGDSINVSSGQSKTECSGAALRHL